MNLKPTSLLSFSEVGNLLLINTIMNVKIVLLQNENEFIHLSALNSAYRLEYLELKAAYLIFVKQSELAKECLFKDVFKADYTKIYINARKVLIDRLNELGYAKYKLLCVHVNLLYRIINNERSSMLTDLFEI